MVDNIEKPDVEIKQPLNPSREERDMDIRYNGEDNYVASMQQFEMDQDPDWQEALRASAEEDAGDKRVSVFDLTGATARGLTHSANATKNLVADAGAFLVKKSNDLGVGIAALFEDDPDVLKFLAQEYQDEQSQVDAMRDLVKQKTNLPVFGKSETGSEIFVEKLAQFIVPFGLASKSKTVAGLGTELGEAAAKKLGKVAGVTTDAFVRGNIASGISSVAAFEAGEQGFAELLLEMSDGDQSFVDEGLEWFSGRGDDAFVDRFKLGLEDFILGGVLGLAGKTAGAIGRAGKEFLAGKQTVDAVVGLAENIRNSQLTEQLKTMKPMAEDIKVTVNSADAADSLQTALDFQAGRKIDVEFTATRVAETVEDHEFLIEEVAKKLEETYKSLDVELIEQAEENIRETAHFHIAKILAEQAKLTEEEVIQYLKNTGGLKLKAAAEQIAAGANLENVTKQVVEAFVDDAIPDEDKLRLFHETWRAAKTVRDGKAGVAGVGLRAVDEANAARAIETQILVDNLDDILSLNPSEQVKAITELLQAGSTTEEVAGTMTKVMLNWIKGGKGPIKVLEAATEVFLDAILSGAAILMAPAATEMMNVVKFMDDIGAATIAKAAQAKRSLTGDVLTTKQKIFPDQTYAGAFKYQQVYFTKHIVGIRQIFKRLGNPFALNRDFQSAKTLPGLSGKQSTDFFTQAKYKSGRQAFSADYQGINRDKFPVLANIVDYLGHFYNVSANTIGAVDNLLKIPNFAGEQTQRAFDILSSKDERVFPFAKKHMSKADELIELMTNPPKGVTPVSALEDLGLSAKDQATFFQVQRKTARAGRDNALDQAMQAPIGEGWMADLIRGAQGMPGVGPVLFPFMRTTTNSLSHVLQRLPVLSFASKRTREALAKGGYHAQRAVAKQITGAAFLYIGMSMYDNGIYTGPEPFDPSERKTLKALGVPPNSILYNDKYNGIPKFDPVTAWLDMGWTIADHLAKANAIEHLTDDEFEELGVILFAVTEGFGHILQNRSMLDSFDQFTKLFEVTGGADKSDFGANLGRWLKRTAAAAAVPKSSAAGMVAAELDPWLRSPETLWEHMKTKIPYLSRSIKPKLDVFGRKINRYPGRTFGVIPMTQAPVMGTPLGDEMRTIGAWINSVRRTQSFEDTHLFGVKKSYAIDLTGEEHYELERLQNEMSFRKEVGGIIIHGEGLYNVLDNLIKDKIYKQMTQEERVEVIKSVTSEVRKDARNFLYFKSEFAEELQRRVSEEGRITRHIANNPLQNQEALIENATTPTFNPAVQE